MKEKSVEDVVPLEPTTQATLVWFVKQNIQLKLYDAKTLRVWTFPICSNYSTTTSFCH